MHSVGNYLRAGTLFSATTFTLDSKMSFSRSSFYAASDLLNFYSIPYILADFTALTYTNNGLVCGLLPHFASFSTIFF